jgi:D-alanyl-D-alanine carboxypeptidase
MTDPISNSRVVLLHPLMQQKMQRVDGVMMAQGVVVRITDGLRNNDQQAADWAKGRNAQGVVIDPHAVVTHAPPGYSPHNFGLAVDLIPGIRGLSTWQPNYDVLHPDFAAMVKACEAEGLVAGIRWAKPKTDPDHFQLAEFPVTPTAAMRQMLAQQGLAAVWNTVGPKEG